MSFHRLLMSAALAAGIASAAPVAAAREPIRPMAAPVAVEGVDVEQVVAIGAGVPLNFTVFGTPGALVVLRIDGGGRALELHEAEPGVYEGSYVIDGHDAIRPESRVRATLQKDGAVAHAALDEPLLLPRGTVPWGASAAPPVDPTPVPPPARAEPTRSVPIAVPPQRVPPAAFAAAPPPADRTPCDDCAVVESVRAIEAAPRGGVIGTIGGAIAGALLGNELGEAHQRRMLTVLGAIGGALAGRQVERQVTRTTEYEVTLRLADGTLLKRRYQQAPPFAPGATIRLGTPLRGAPSL